MITIPSMPTRHRSLPQLEIDLEAHDLRILAFVLDRIVSPEGCTAGLCLSVKEMLKGHALGHHSVHVAYKFADAVGKGMNPPEENIYHQYVGSYISKEWKYNLTIEKLAAIRTAWARHIARSIYEQIGD